jgi:hypothetical protein
MTEPYISYADKQRQLEQDFGNFERLHHAYELLFGQPLTVREGQLQFSDTPSTPQQRRDEKGLLTGELLRKNGTPESFRQNPNLLARFFEEDKFKGTRLTQHQITFNIPKGGDELGEIVLYNITENVRETLIQYGTSLPTIQLKAGYVTQQDLPLVFLGEVTKIVETFEGHTRVTRLTVKTGVSNLQVFSTKSFGAGTSLDTIIRFLIQEMGLAYGTIYIPRTESGEIVVDKNFLVNGNIYSALKRIEKDYGLQVWLDDGTVNVTPEVRSLLDDQFGFQNIERLRLRSDATRQTLPSDNSRFAIPQTDDPELPFYIEQNPNKRALTGFDNFLPDRNRAAIKKEPVEVLSTKNGNIIGSPVTEADSTLKLKDMVNPPKVKVKTQLNGNYKIGQRVLVESKFVNNVYEIKALRHVGNYEGSNWFTELEMDLVDNWVVDI